MQAAEEVMPLASPTQSVVDGADQGQPSGKELPSILLHQHPEQRQLLKGFQWVIG